MSSFYVRSDFFEADAGFSDNQFLIVPSKNFDDPEFLKAIASRYIESLNTSNNSNILTNTTLNLSKNGATFDAFNLYLPCGYISGQITCVSENALNTLGNVELKTPNYIYKQTLLGDYATPVYDIDIYQYNTAIVINKVYHEMLPSGDGSSATMQSKNMTAGEIAKVPTNNLYLNYSYCKVLNFKISPYNSESYFYQNLIIIEDKNLDYLEDFSAKFYYDAGTQRYYLNSSLIECSLKMYDYFFPYILLVSSDAWVSKEVFRGTVKLQLESQNDANLEDISTEINFNYINICESSTTVAGNNTIACTSNAGEVSINANGVITLFDDQQICPIGEAAKTVIAVFTLKALELLTLYKDFSAVATVKADVWGYNFRYIKYYDGTTYYNFKSNGSVVSSTISYIDETLDLSKYFSIKEISDGTNLSDSGTIVAITLRFKIYREATTDADATDYSIDVPVEIKIPEIISIEEDVEARQIIIKTNYATKLTYRFNKETSVTVNITDTADGSNQETIISSSGKNGSFYCKAYNFYYDLGGATRNLYITNELSLDLVRNIVIPSFNLVVKIGGVSKTIYDENNTTVTLNFTDLTQDQIANYKVYSDYITDNGSYTFQLTYNLSGSSFSSMFLRLGSDPALNQLVSSGGVSSYTITKQNLFKLLDNNNQITISFLADGQTSFNFPFTFLNTSQTNPPVCTAFSLSRVQLDYPKASTSFSLSYTYADEIEYSVIDQNDEVLSGPFIIKEKFADIEYYFTSGASRQRSFQINGFSIPNSATTIRVRATVRNIISATANPQKAESVQTSSTIYYIPLKIGEAEVILYSDFPVSTPIEKIKKSQDFWAFLQLKDEAGSVIPVGNYANYLAIGYKPQIFMLESADSNKDLDGVTSIRADDYTFKFNIKDNDKFDDQNAVFQAQYQPIIDTEIQ